MPNFYYADPHFFDERALKNLATTRPFATVSDMNDYLVNQHNAVVDHDDDVYILGNFARFADKNDLRAVFDALNGRKHLVVGGDNAPEVFDLAWASVAHQMTVVDEGERIYLSHLPTMSWPGMDAGRIHFHGGNYGRLPSQPNAVDVGLDAWLLTPTTARDAINNMIRDRPDVTVVADAFRP